MRTTVVDPNIQDKVEEAKILTLEYRETAGW